jgi:hypothetical protein
VAGLMVGEGVDLEVSKCRNDKGFRLSFGYFTKFFIIPIWIPLLLLIC